MEDNNEQGTKPKNKKLVYYGIGAVVLIGAYLYFKNKSASSTASSLVTGGAIDPLTGQPYQPGVGSLAQSTGAGIQGLSAPLIIKNIIHTSGGTGPKSTATSTLPTTSTPQYPTSVINNYNPLPSPAPVASSTPTAKSSGTTSGTVTPVGVIGQPLSAQQLASNNQTRSFLSQTRQLMPTYTPPAPTSVGSISAGSSGQGPGNPVINLKTAPTTRKGGGGTLVHGL